MSFNFTRVITIFMVIHCALSALRNGQYKLVSYDSAKPVFTLCLNPVKNQACTLRCEPYNHGNTWFYEYPVNGIGLGGCFKSECKTTDDRYEAFRNATATYLKINHLNRSKDEQQLVCDNDNNLSVEKRLIVYTLLKSVNIEALPSEVTNMLELTAEGYCIYPDNVTAEASYKMYQDGLQPLVPLVHYSNPIIEYLQDDQCETDEFKVVVHYSVKVSGYSGGMSFRVKLTQIGIGISQTSPESNVVTFLAINPSSTSPDSDQAEFPSWVIAILVVLLFLSLLLAFFGVRFLFWKMIQKIITCQICRCRCSH